jgi:hypothetical protein
MTNLSEKSKSFENGWRTVVSCLSCHDNIASEYAKHYKTCKCKSAFIDESHDYVRYNADVIIGYQKVFPNLGSLVYYNASADVFFVAEQDASENHTMRIFLDNLVTRLISVESFNNYVKQEDGILCLGKL